ncbi:MAG: DnaJ C-terminal domain-containing protein [Candidatus Pacebacteria bacterium]|nr:DnaJ C-terminal domain-containing protein [Candidatus Paceibacterota bacterium]
MNKDLYTTLGVSESATTDEIKKAFHKLAHKYHPDRPDGDEAKFKEINEAYQILSNEKKRQQYDSYRKFGGQQGFNSSQGFSGFSGFENFTQGFDFGDIFSEFFNQGQSRRRNQNKDILVEIEISLKEADMGVSKTIKYPRFVKCSHCGGFGYEPNTKVTKCDKCKGTGKINKVQKTFFGNFQTTVECDKCKGKGEIYEKSCSKCKGNGSVKITEEKEINIPQGIRNQDKIRFRNYGDTFYANETPGDLILVVFVKNNTDFIRHQDDLYLDYEISFIKAILGSKEAITTIRDDKVSFLIPKGTKENDVIVVKNEGMHKYNSNSKGNLYIKIKINIPKRISKKAEKLLSELEKEIN